MNDIATAVQAATAGGESADFDQLYAQWYEPVVRLCRRTLRGHGDAEALAQEVFVRAWASWDSYDPGRPFGPWISTIARRLCTNEIATGKRREARAAEVRGPSGIASAPAEEQFERVAQSDLVARVLGRIPLRHRRLLFLSDVEGWSTDEIARFEGVTPTAVRVTLCRARRSFRRWWEHDVRTGVAAAFGLVHRLRGWLDLVGVHRQEWAVGVVALFAVGSGVG
nr:sigma-70 family RNA polymerase sigma factor [Actinomycetota bacterium]